MGGAQFLMSEVPLYLPNHATSDGSADVGAIQWLQCEDRVLDGPASWEKGSKGRNVCRVLRGCMIGSMQGYLAHKKLRPPP